MQWRSEIKSSSVKRNDFVLTSLPKSDCRCTSKVVECTRPKDDGMEVGVQELVRTETWFHLGRFADLVASTYLLN